MNTRRKVIYFAMLALLAAAFVATAPAASAQQNRNPDITRTELRNFDQFLDAHPQIRAELQKNPALVNDSSYLQKHPDLQQFLQSHPAAKEELQENPTAFMKQEGSFETGENKGTEQQPHMQAALQHLKQAQAELQQAEQDKGGHRVKAIQLAQQAEAEVQAGINYDIQHEKQK
jgi:hypothetical protein